VKIAAYNSKCYTKRLVETSFHCKLAICYIIIIIIIMSISSSSITVLTYRKNTQQD